MNEFPNKKAEAALWQHFGTFAQRFLWAGIQDFQLLKLLIVRI
jgi:hypothetical protein